MRKTIFVLIIAIIYSSCSKDHSVNPVKKNSFNVSFSIDAASSTWQQVLGGQANLSFTAKGNDTLTASSLTDSLDLKNIGAYSKQVIAGTYDIALKTKSTAVADTFIRFTSQAKNVVIDKAVAISLAATTTDGVITISKKLVDSTTVPTFTATESGKVYNFGVANEYYFIYVTGSKGGKITFTEATTGDLFIENLTVSALNQYDLTATLTKTGAVVVHAYSFKLKN
jgi:hypothetical protein